MRVVETALPRQLLNNQSGKMYESFVKEYSGSMEPAAFASCICQKMIESKNYSGDDGTTDVGQRMKSISGKIFELIIAEILKHHNITPFYTQAVMRYVPNSKFDFLCFNDRTPVILSAKISLAERWRQSAFEGYFLKQVYRQAKSYVITNDERSTILRNNDIQDNKISGIDRFYYVQSHEMNFLISELKSLTFKKAEPVNPVSESNVIIE